MLGNYGGDFVIFRPKVEEILGLGLIFVFGNSTKIEQNQNNCFLSSHLGQPHRPH
jgi:hypothetical protein